ncbi:uncharacterized protein LOC134540503 [Bacillus rossius redtenbacheri]|uniref:uncharacterized protein LOC134540503 n=1 Tax=Bacillus rossius redtenbacheri TaxID=93214 RepID=UPI002FDCA6CF
MNLASEELPKFGMGQDPVLEELRDSVRPAEEDPGELERATSRLHAGFLFAAEGLPALQQICKFVLGGDRLSGGWREFAALLGVDPVAVQCLWNSNDLLHVCERILAAFAHREDASLDKVVSALHKMKRLDAICQSKPHLLELVDAVLGKEKARGHPVTGNYQRSLITPEYLPPVPMILCDIPPVAKKEETEPLGPVLENLERQREPCERDPPRITSQPQNEQEVTEYAYVVMLTFANDGVAAARRVASVFRQTRAADGRRVGVVILQEHSVLVSSFGNQYVLGLFNDVDYVVPILTQGYVDSVLERGSRAPDADFSCLDQQYARYVFLQMQAEYAKHCINDRVRPVIADGFVRQAQREFVMRDALFQAWWAESSAAELARCLLCED